MVIINDSRCVDGDNVSIILKRIEKIKSEAIVIKKEGKANELQKTLE